MSDRGKKNSTDFPKLDEIRIQSPLPNSSNRTLAHHSGFFSLP